MRKLEPLKYLAGSMAVYYIMTACSASPSSSATLHAGSSSSSGGASSGSGGSGSGGSSSGSSVPDANADETQSGTRLKANYFVGGDGSRQFAYFTDSTLNNQQCAFLTASDGTTRCLPTAGSAYAGSYYADSDCSTPLGVDPSTCAPTKNAYAYASDACGTFTYHIYPVTGAYSGTIYTGTPASCTALTTPPTGTVYSLGAATDPSTFQQATIQAM